MAAKYKNASPAISGARGNRRVVARGKTAGKARPDGAVALQLNHQVLNNLAGELDTIERAPDVGDVARFFRLVTRWMPTLIEAARQVVPGEALAEVSIPGFVPKGSLNSREHHMVKARRVARERHLVTAALACNAPSFRGAWERVGRVVITRNSVGKPDSDQVYGYCKGTRDAVAEFLGTDDGSEAVKWKVVACRCKRAEAGTVIRFEEREEA